jgi:hypothetical protein
VRDADAPLAWAAIDFLCCLLLVLYTLIAPPVKQSSSIDTYGLYAVTITWPKNDTDDVDLYVRDPQGQIAYFANASAGLMHLEHDDLGMSNDTEGATTLRFNGERCVLRGTVAGEYTANVHLYRADGSHAVPVTVRLYRLRGSDSLVVERRVVLRSKGDERTAFRFTVDGKGDAGQINHLSASFVGTARAR